MTSATGKGPKGATLLEMSLTLAIVALVLLVTWPRWSALRPFPVDARAEAR